MKASHEEVLLINRLLMAGIHQSFLGVKASTTHYNMKNQIEVGQQWYQCKIRTVWSVTHFSRAFNVMTPKPSEVEVSCSSNYDSTTECWGAAGIAMTEETQAEVWLAAVEVVASEKLQAGMAGNKYINSRVLRGGRRIDNLDISELRLLL